MLETELTFQALRSEEKLVANKNVSRISSARLTSHWERSEVKLVADEKVSTIPVTLETSHRLKSYMGNSKCNHKHTIISSVSNKHKCQTYRVKGFRIKEHLSKIIRSTDVPIFQSSTLKIRSVLEHETKIIGIWSVPWESAIKAGCELKRSKKTYGTFSIPILEASQVMSNITNQ